MSQKKTWYWVSLGDDSYFALATPIEVVQLAKTPGPAGSPARRQIVELYRKDIYEIAWHESGSAEDAKDLTQDFCLQYLDEKAYEAIDPARPGFRTYLKGWVRFAARTMKKKRGRRHEVSYEESAAAERVADRRRSPGEMVDLLLTRSRISRVLEMMEKELGSQAWEVFDAVHLQREGEDEATQDELAARLGATRAHVRALLEVARRVFIRYFVKLVAPELHVPEQMDEELAVARRLLEGPISRYWVRPGRQRKANPS